MIFSRLSNNRGVALITVIILMLTVALIGASLVELVSSVNMSTERIIDETKARYLAEAGIAYAVHVLRTSAGADVELNDKAAPIPLGDGTFMVTFDTHEALITAVGKVHGISKKIQLQYNVL